MASTASQWYHETITPSPIPEEPHQDEEKDPESQVKTEDSESKESCRPFCGSWWCCSLWTFVIMVAMFFAGMLVSTLLWSNSATSEEEKRLEESYRSPVGEPWEFHARELIIANLKRKPGNCASWTGVDEAWFREAQADPALWPKFMNGHGRTGNLLRDNRLNRKNVLFWTEFSQCANLHIFEAELEGGKLSSDNHRFLYSGADSKGPIGNYWWQIDRDWIHTHKNASGPNSGQLGNASPPLKSITPQIRAMDAATSQPTIDVSTLDQDGGWIQWGGLKAFGLPGYGFIQKRIDDTTSRITLQNGKRLPLEVKVENGRAKAYCELHGRKVRLVYQFLKTEKKPFIGDMPAWMLFIGEDVLSGKRIIECRELVGMTGVKRVRAGWTPSHGEDRKFYTTDEITEFQRRWRQNDFPGSQDVDPIKEWYCEGAKADATEQNTAETEPLSWMSCC